jgi:hypothetical protein
MLSEVGSFEGRSYAVEAPHTSRYHSKPEWSLNHEPHPRSSA